MSIIISVSLPWGASLGSTLVYLCELAYIYWNCTSCTPLNFLGSCHCEILAVVFGSECFLSMHLMPPVFWQTCCSVIQLVSFASWSSKLICFTVHEYYFYKVKFLFCLSALLFRLLTCSQWTAAEHCQWTFSASTASFMGCSGSCFSRLFFINFLLFWSWIVMYWKNKA